MKREELFEAIGKIGSETVERNAWEDKEDKVYRQRVWRRWAAVAAAVAVMTGAGVLAYSRLPLDEVGSGPQTVLREEKPERNMTAEDNENTDEKGESAVAEDIAVDITTLIAYSGGGNVAELAAEFATVGIGEYRARYEKVPIVSGESLRKCIGEEIAGNEGWYKVLGHDELQYLIREEDGDCSLWKFGWYDAEEYPYIDVLKDIYGLRSADDIRLVSVVAANMDNTDEGELIQKQIGRGEIWEPELLRELYDVLCGMTCYGHGHWDMIDYGDSDTGMLEAVRLGRYLTIELKGGGCIDALKYTGVSGMFYEYNGVAYNRLSAMDQETIETLLGFRVRGGKLLDELTGGTATEGSLTEDVTDETAPADVTAPATQDIPVDEEHYREAHRYSDEIEAAQSAISQAMVRGELPFVTSSAIHEDPVRISVTVNTKDETLLEKLKEYEADGVVVEIVYFENRAVLE